MSIVHKRNRKTMGLAIGVGLGVLVSLTITIFAAALLAWMMAKEILAGQGIGVVSGIVLVLSSAVGCLVSWMAVKSGKLLVCGIHMAVYLLVLLCVNALFFGGQYQGVAVNAAMILIGGAVVILGVPAEKSAGKHRHKIRGYR